MANKPSLSLYPLSYILHFIYCMKFRLSGEQCEVKETDMYGSSYIGVIASFIKIIKVTA